MELVLSGCLLAPGRASSENVTSSQCCPAPSLYHLLCFCPAAPMVSGGTLAVRHLCVIPRVTQEVMVEGEPIQCFRKFYCFSLTMNFYLFEPSF